MKTIFRTNRLLVLIGLIASLASIAISQTRPYRVSDRNVRTVINRIETRTATFRRTVAAYDRSRVDENRIESLVSDFEYATGSLRTSFAARRSTTEDVQEVLDRASEIDRLMADNQITRTARNQWRLIVNDLNTLANYYRVSWNRNYRNDPNDNRYGTFDTRLSGTYRLNSSRSDNVATTIERAIANIDYNDNQRERVQRNLERRLSSPDMIMIEKQGQQITMASSTMSRISFRADGINRSEESENGRMVNVRASATATELAIAYEGDRANDYYVSFTPMNNGQLRVSRRVYLENRNETVTIASVYDKTDKTARWDVEGYRDSTDSVVSRFVVPNNTRMTATLDNQISTKAIQDGDRFTMTVTEPSQFYGATIAGRVIGEKSGVVSGRATLTLDFESIRLRNGTTYQFAGIIEEVRLNNGDSVQVNNEGVVRDRSQTKKTVIRTGIGAAIGAIIGAIAGGGKGAVIGAGVGAGAGAGTIVLQGRDNLDLATGTTFTITATAPAEQVGDR